MNKARTYIGVDKETLGGMTTIGKTIRDAWIFEVIPETETCEGWNLGRIDALLQEVNAEWDKYGCMVGQLPEEIRARHNRIHKEAIEKAKAAGWSGELETDNENYIETSEK